MSPTALTTAVALSNPAGTTPAKFSMDTADVSDFATLTTALAGANNDLVYTAVAPGVAGNSITIRYVDPAANNAALGVVVAGTAITVNLATDAGGAITSTGATVRTAVNADGVAGLLVQGANAAANDGTGVVIALAATALAGGDAGGNTFTAADNRLVIVRNDHATLAKTVTARNAAGGLLTAISLAAAEQVILGPFDPTVHGTTVTLEGQSTDIKMRLVSATTGRTSKLALQGAKADVDAAWGTAGTSPGDKRALRRVSHKMAVALRRITGTNPDPHIHEVP